MKLTGHIILIMMLLTASALFAPANAQTKFSGVVATEGGSDFMQEYEIFFRFDKTDVGSPGKVCV